jgi:2-acylglycerol O-acyltransferase 2
MITVPSYAANLAPKFAPLNIPMPRRLQTASIVVWLILYPLGITIFTILASYESIFPFALAYLIYMFLDPAPEMGGRKKMWLRRLPLWEFMRDFFPVSLIKTAELDPSKNYVFGYHRKNKHTHFSTWYHRNGRMGQFCN